ncbi:hypothetical protein Tco_0683489 [Tanacetum coccineum]|uniref:Uncharacterized protein n=1 Tax=Tanacetum coccineum TaxID=301880 RepID=A0ABQ4XUD8_9ASTR
MRRRLRSMLEIKKKARLDQTLVYKMKARVVHAGPNLEHMDLGTSDASTQQKPEQMDEVFTTTAYPNVQENLKLPTEDQLSVGNQDKRKLCKVFSAIRELVDIVKKTLELGARGVE